MKYQVAVLQGCLGPFAIVRAEGALYDAIPVGIRPSVQQAVQKCFGNVPIAYLARERRGYLFDAPDPIVDDVGLVMEDLSCRPVVWRELAIPAEDLANVA